MKTEHSGPCPFGISHVVSVLTFAFLLTVPALSQENLPAPGSMIHRSPPPAGAKTHTAIPGERFAAGGLRSWIFGKDYRQLWTMPLEMPVLNIDSVGGGLTPLRTGGFGQSISLHFTGKDGHRYTVRSLDKDPTKRLNIALKQTVVEDVLQDQISALLPTGALVTDPLMEAAGILHSPHKLVIIPDDPRLGKYREEFAGLIGTLQIHPSELPDNQPGFAGSRSISGTERTWERLEDNPKHRIDSRAFLKARLFDFLINDKDRHAGQWRWARFPDGENYKWVPIPEDRDQAFIDLDGAGMAISRLAIPKTIKFEATFPNQEGLTRTGWEIDREFLSDLEKSVWEDVTAELQSELTDAVIDNAAKRLPKAYYDEVGAEVAASLKSRRDALKQFADEYYTLISRQVDILATDKSEYADYSFRGDGTLRVEIGRVNKEGEKSPAYFKRTFLPSETHEVRTYLRGGDDVVTVSGEKGKIKLHIDGGGGDDSYANLSSAPAGKVRIYDHRGKNTFGENGLKVTERKFRRPPAKEPNDRYALDWGKFVSNVPILQIDSDLGVFFGWQHRREIYGFRKAPFSSHHLYRAAVASDGWEPEAGYQGIFREIFPNIDGIVDLEFSAINVLRFHGLGNGTNISKAITGDLDFYNLEQQEFVFAPGLAFRSGVNHGEKHDNKESFRPEFTGSIGLILRYGDTPVEDNSDKFIGSVSLDSPIYGLGSFGQAGVQAGFQLDSRDHAGYPKKGFLLTATGTLYPEIWDVVETFGKIKAQGSAYLTAPMPATPTVALRLAAEKVWGRYPFQDAAYIGGGSSLRGFRRDRFAGDASLVGSAELRFQLFPVKLLVPGQVGAFAAIDMGRVFLDSDPANADEWHRGVGGGLWISIMDRLQTFSLSIMNSDEKTGYYFDAGFMF